MNPSSKTIIIGAAGQVGRALYKSLCKRYFILEHDIAEKEFKGKTLKLNVTKEEGKGNICHVCFPYSNTFVKDVVDYAKLYESPLVVIHSSIKPGTTKEINEQGVAAVHTPTLLDQDNLYSMKHFRRLIGFDDPSVGIMAEKHLRHCFNTALIQGSYQTELTDLCYNMYIMVCRSTTFEIMRMFELFKSDHSIFMEMLSYSNIGFVSLNKQSSMLMNYKPDMSKIPGDYRLPLIDLIPEKICSAFFKLSKKSYDIEISRIKEYYKSLERKKDDKTATEVPKVEVQEPASSDTGS